ncbi:hypothetical protein Pelo_10166 [Pelomyxa schiedti]|nr:hypothetical protein Pelo_10166 [Pelomyxa schiedti]
MMQIRSFLTFESLMMIRMVTMIYTSFIFWNDDLIFGKPTSDFSYEEYLFTLVHEHGQFLQVQMRWLNFNDKGANNIPPLLELLLSPMGKHSISDRLFPVMEAVIILQTSSQHDRRTISDSYTATLGKLT